MRSNLVHSCGYGHPPRFLLCFIFMMDRKLVSGRFARGASWRFCSCVGAAAALLPQAGHAYVGPGAGLTALGTVVALILALVLALIGFVWYPLKRLRRKRDSRSEDEDPERERE